MPRGTRPWNKTVSWRDTRTKAPSSRSRWNVTSISTRCGATSSEIPGVPGWYGAEDWMWGTAWVWLHPDDCRALPLCDWPVPRPDDWLDPVNQALTGAEIEALRKCTERGRPYGSSRWAEQTAKQLELESTLRSRGRPRKTSWSSCSAVVGTDTRLACFWQLTCFALSSGKNVRLLPRERGGFGADGAAHRNSRCATGLTDLPHFSRVVSLI